ncbi:hypothetical protein BH09PSE4_BH09PSE4_12360 [soil metagenome]
MFIDTTPIAADTGAARWGARIANHVARATSGLSAVGTTGIAFRVDADGSLSGIHVTHSSGDTGLDHSAVAMLEAAVPFPAGPAGAAPRTQFAVVGVPSPVGFTRPVSARRLAHA